MPLEDDLDLEFEDEEENKSEKNETVDFDGNLEFHTPIVSRPRGEPPSLVGSASRSYPSDMKSPSLEGQLRKIEEARRPQGLLGHLSQVESMSDGTSALKREGPIDSSGVEKSLQEQMMTLQMESQVKVALAEFKVDFLSDVLSDMKLMDHQIGQLLARINAKYPDSKNEVHMIKKIMSDFMGKKRK
jgi:hypothetical protein